MAKDEKSSLADGGAVRPPQDRDPPSWLEDRPLRHISEDRLDFRESAKALARQLVTTRVSGGRQSLTISLEGPWGSGKSSYSRLLIEELESLSGGHPPIVVPFNVWQSGAMALSPWGALAYRIGQAFYTDFHRRCLDRPRNRKVPVGSPKDLADGDRANRKLIQIDPENAELMDSRLHWIEVAHRLSLAIPKKEWAPCLKLFGDAPTKVPGRRLSWRQGGLDAFLSLGQAGLSVASGGVDDAIQGTGRAAAALLNKRLIEGPAWGTDTLEFVAQLDQLLAVLHPEAETWRCIIAVDDVTRLDPDELPSVLETLGYLRELRDVLVLLSLDEWLVRKLHTMGRRREAPPDPEGEDAPQAPRAGEADRTHRIAEPFLTRLVNLRTQIPSPRPGELGRMLGSYFQDLHLPATWASAAARHLLEHEIRTPRQIKRALLWLWVRLGEIEAGSKSHASFEDSLLELLLDIYLLSDSHNLELDAEHWHRRRHLLVHLAVQPWDLRHWFDKNLFKVFEALREGQETHPPVENEAGSPAPELDLFELERRTVALTEHLRWLSLVVHFDNRQLDACRKIAQAEWKPWQEMLLQSSRGLLPAIAARDRAALKEAWTRFVSESLDAPIIRAMIELNSIARRFHLVEESIDQPEKTIARWFDYDGIIRMVEDPAIDPDLRRLAITFRHLVRSVDTVRL